MVPPQMTSSTTATWRPRGPAAGLPGRAQQQQRAAAALRQRQRQRQRQAASGKAAVRRRPRRQQQRPASGGAEGAAGLGCRSLVPCAAPWLPLVLVCPLGIDSCASPFALSVPTGGCSRKVAAKEVGPSHFRATLFTNNATAGCFRLAGWRLSMRRSGRMCGSAAAGSRASTPHNWRRQSGALLHNTCQLGGMQQFCPYSVTTGTNMRPHSSMPCLHECLSTNSKPCAALLLHIVKWEHH